MSDHCASCFAPLKIVDGVRYACSLHPRAGYWSEAEPERGHTMKACLKSQHGRPTLHYYGWHLPPDSTRGA